MRQLQLRQLALAYIVIDFTHRLTDSQTSQDFATEEIKKERLRELYSLTRSLFPCFALTQSQSRPGDLLYSGQE